MLATHQAACAYGQARAPWPHTARLLRGIPHALLQAGWCHGRSSCRHFDTDSHADMYPYTCIRCFTRISTCAYVFVYVHAHVPTCMPTYMYVCTYRQQLVIGSSIWDYLVAYLSVSSVAWAYMHVPAQVSNTGHMYSRLWACMYLGAVEFCQTCVQMDSNIGL